jgi:plastocyanin
METMESRVEAAAGRARWTQLAALGLLMVGLGPLLMFAAGLIWGLELGEDAPFFLGLIVLPLVAAFLVLRFGTWAKIVGIVVGLAGAAMMFWTAFGLAAPQAFFDFVPGVLVIPGALIAIVGSVAAIVAERRGRVATRREGVEARAVNVVVAVVALLAVVSGVLTITSHSTVDATDAAAEVRLKDFEFHLDATTVPGGSQIAVRNQDPFLHTFTIEALDIDVTLGPNSAELVDIPAQAGTYVVFCRPHTMDPESPSEDDMATQLAIG